MWRTKGGIIIVIHLTDAVNYGPCRSIHFLSLEHLLPTYSGLLSRLSSTHICSYEGAEEPTHS